MAEHAERMVAIALACCILLSLAGVAYAAEQANLLTNGSFEELGPVGWPVGFSPWTGEGIPEFAVDESVSRSGMRSLRIAGDGQARGSFSSAVAVSGGRAYQFTVWYRCTEGMGGGAIVARLMASGADGSGGSEKVQWCSDWLEQPEAGWYEVRSGNFHMMALVDDVGDSWQLLTATFFLPENVTRLDIGLFNWLGNGTVWFDDISLIPVPTITRTVGAVSDQKPSVARASVDLELRKKEHPRLVVTTEGLQRMKNLIATDKMMQHWYAALRLSADSILTEPLSQYDKLLKTKRTVLDRVRRLAIAYWVEGDYRYAERAWRELQAAADFPDWNPSHFLDTAEMTHAFALGYDWLYDVWTEEQRAILREAIVEKGLLPALQAYRGTASWGSWVRADHNWNIVCNGGIAMGALAIADEVPDLAEEILRSGLKSVPVALAGFAPNGGWGEGMGYWHYSIRYLVPYIAALQTALGTDFGLGEMSGISDTGYFPIYLTGPTNSSFNFADSGPDRLLAPELFWLAEKYGQPAYAWWQESSAARESTAGDVLWYDPALSQGFSPDSLPLDRHFKGVQVVTLRSAWEDSDAAFLGFKAGDNRTNHGNLDLGTFVFDALGVRWAEDLGGDSYDLPGYFGSGRWAYYRTRAEGQNTLVINPGYGADQNPNAVASIYFQESRPQEAVAIADLTPGYIQHATKVERGVALLDNRRQVLIQDEIVTRRPSEIWWFMHTKANIEIGPDATSATLSIGNKRLEVRVLSPANARLSVMPARPLPSSPQSTDQNSNAGIRKLAIHLTDVSSVTLAVQLVPVREGEHAPLVPAVLPLEGWQRAGDQDVLWPAMPRVTMNLASPSLTSQVQGKVPLNIKINTPKELPLKEVRVKVNGEQVYSGTTAPTDKVLDTLKFNDGPNMLTVEADLHTGAAMSWTYAIRIANCWRISDPLAPPLAGGWLGGLDFSLTAAESTGWMYATDNPAFFSGDNNRRVRSENTTEYLVWETPKLKEFALRIYSTEATLGETLQLATSLDSNTWQNVPYQLRVGEPHESGWYAIDAVGELPEESGVRLFRMTLVESEIAPEQVQLGHVELRGYKE